MKKTLAASLLVFVVVLAGYYLDQTESRKTSAQCAQHQAVFIF